MLLLIAFCLIAPTAQETPDEPFSLAGDVKLKYFASTNERDIVSRDYSGYGGHPFFELGLSARFDFKSDIYVNAYPYFWYSRENRIARIGLAGEVGYEVLEDSLWAGWYHHSWHNADIDSPGNNGRSQDAVFAKWNFWNPEICGSEIKLTADARYFAHNSEPIEIKDVYSDGEKEAFAELALSVSGNCRSFGYYFRPYLQPASGRIRYGATAEVSIPVNKNISLFSDAVWYTTNIADNDTIHMIGIGLIVRFN